jgi:hypothetical protein
MENEENDEEFGYHGYDRHRRRFGWMCTKPATAASATPTTNAPDGHSGPNAAAARGSPPSRASLPSPLPSPLPPPLSASVSEVIRPPADLCYHATAADAALGVISITSCEPTCAGESSLNHSHAAMPRSGRRWAWRTLADAGDSLPWFTGTLPEYDHPTVPGTALAPWRQPDKRRGYRPSAGAGQRAPRSHSWMGQ